MDRTNVVKINLAVLLAGQKMKQSDLARKTSIRPNTINALYNEFADHVSLKQIASICDTLGCELSELLEYTPKKMNVKK